LCGPSARRITPPQAIAIDENNAAQDAGLAVGLGDERFETRHLGVDQPKQIRLGQRSVFSGEPCSPAEIIRS
jgi:hypothetical protein